MIIKFEDGKRMLMTGELQRKPNWLAGNVQDVTDVLRHDFLREMLEMAVSYNAPQGLIESIRMEIERVAWFSKVGV